MPRSTPRGGTTKVTTAGTNVGGIALAGNETIDPTQNVTASTIDRAQEEEFRKRQLAFADRLEGAISGTGGPSVAQIQLQQSTDRNIAQQMAVARSQGGPLANRQALMNISSLNQQAGQDAVKQRFAEALSAQQTLQAVLSDGRSTDADIAKAQANLNQAAATANALAANTRAAQQAQLNQNVTLANTSARNTANISQADINAKVEQARIAAAATVNAAGIGASASRYGTDATNYRFNAELAATMDQYYGGQTGGNITGGYNTDINTIKNDQVLTQQQDDALNNIGGGLAQTSKFGAQQQQARMRFGNAVPY